MDANRKKQDRIAVTNEACSNMILCIRQLRLSVLDLFNTLADTGVDPEKNHPPIMTSNHHHDNHTSLNNSNGKLYHQQTIANLTTSHSLCSAANPPPRIQKQLEYQQHSDLIQFVNNSISTITGTIRNLEQDISILLQNSSLINTGEAVHIGMDSSLDKHNLFLELCTSYKTLSRLHDYSTHCHALLHQQSLKRVHKRSDTSVSYSQSSMLTQNQSSQQQSALAAARSESVVATFNPYIYKICTSKQSITSVLDAYLKLCEHMEGTYSQPFGVSTGVLQISVDRVLKAILVMRGIVIDAVIVKAYHESFANKASRDGSSTGLLVAAGACDQSSMSFYGGGRQFVDPEVDDIDLWSESRYNAFRRLTHHANAAVLHFQYPTYPEIAVRSFLSWFNSYSNLFLAVCSRCNMKLRKFMPPICRDFSAGFYPHHDSCK